MTGSSPPAGSVAAAVALLLVLLAEREVVRAFTGRPRAGGLLGVAVFPLLVVFGTVVATRTADLLR